MADMDDEVSQRTIRPPLLMLLLLVAGWVSDRLWPLPFVPSGWPEVWIGTILVVIGVGIVALAFRQFRRAGTNIETYKPTHAIVDSGLYAYSRNPIYLAGLFPFAGAAVAFDTLWMALAAIPFFLVIGSYVIPREEAYLERKFGAAYLDYKARVRRWL